MLRTSMNYRTLLFVVGFALICPAPALAQQPRLPQKPGFMFVSLITDYRDLRRGGIPKDDLPKVREAMKKLAKYYADLISHPAVWNASRNFKNDPRFGQIPTIDGDNGILHDLDRFLIEPVPTNLQNNLEPADYIREIGAALDAALKPLIESNPEQIVRINAARVLAHVARTGSLRSLRDGHSPAHQRQYANPREVLHTARGRGVVESAGHERPEDAKARRRTQGDR